MNTPRILVDADACPVKAILERAAERHGIPVILVLAIPMKAVPRPNVTIQTVTGGPDAVDDWIMAHCQPGDIVVTQDIPLAAGVIERGGQAIGVRGEDLNAGNIAGRLATRNLLMQLRDEGAPIGGPRPFTQKDRRRFADTLGRILDRMRQNPLKPAE
jgi:uncharacterized protein